MHVCCRCVYNAGKEKAHAAQSRSISLDPLHSTGKRIKTVKRNGKTNTFSTRILCVHLVFSLLFFFSFDFGCMPCFLVIAALLFLSWLVVVLLLLLVFFCLFLFLYFLSFWLFSVLSFLRLCSYLLFLLLRPSQ